jgi:lysophospholipase L1-like esterase
MRFAALWLALLVPQADKADRWEKDIAAFEAQDAKAPPPEGGIVFVGSSSIRMWKTKEAFPDLPTINRGFGGSEMGDALRYCDRIVTKYKPRQVVVFAGGNDINAKKTPEQVLENAKALAAKILAALPEARVHFISLFPNVKRQAQDGTCRKYNALIESHTKTDKRLNYIDTASSMRAADGGPRPELLADDGLHMNSEGYKIWNDLVGKELRK